MRISYLYDGLIPVVLVDKNEAGAMEIAERAREESALIEHDNFFEIIRFTGWSEQLFNQVARGVS